MGRWLEKAKQLQSAQGQTMNSSNQVSAAVETITPEIAKDYLTKNTSNRPLTESHVEKLSKAMQAGEWQMNGDALRFSEAGTLLDGQHRLSAIVRAKQPVSVMVIRGLPNNSFETIDQGKKRNTADVLSIKKYKHYTKLSSAAAYSMQIQSNGYPPNYTANMPSTHQIIAWIEANPDILICTDRATKYGNAVRLASASVLISTYFIVSRKYGIDDIELFIMMADDGAELEKGSPVFLFRETLFRNAVSHSKLTKQTKSIYLFKAIRAYVTGKKLPFLRFSAEENLAKVCDPFQWDDK